MQGQFYGRQLARGVGSEWCSPIHAGGQLVGYVGVSVKPQSLPSTYSGVYPHWPLQNEILLTNWTCSLWLHDALCQNCI